MAEIRKVAGYVKLAKLWERSKSTALEFHRQYFRELFDGCTDFALQDVYIDITGYKETYKRVEMLRLMRDCTLRKVDCIVTQTRAYLAANHEELCFLLYFLFELPVRIDIITQDDDIYRIDTIKNIEHQREALHHMAKSRVSLAPEAYKDWHSKVIDGMNKLVL